ncbi:hypothetical protein AYI68_g5513, partial [Smittium mucronatum]
PLTYQLPPIPAPNNVPISHPAPILPPPPPPFNHNFPPHITNSGVQISSFSNSQNHPPFDISQNLNPLSLPNHLPPPPPFSNYNISSHISQIPVGFNLSLIPPPKPPLYYELPASLMIPELAQNKNRSYYEPINVSKIQDPNLSLSIANAPLTEHLQGALDQFYIGYDRLFSPESNYDIDKLLSESPENISHQTEFVSPNKDPIMDSYGWGLGFKDFLIENITKPQCDFYLTKKHENINSSHSEYSSSSENSSDSSSSRRTNTRSSSSYSSNSDSNCRSPSPSSKHHNRSYRAQDSSSSKNYTVSNSRRRYSSDSSSDNKSKHSNDRKRDRFRGRSRSPQTRDRSRSSSRPPHRNSHYRKENYQAEIISHHTDYNSGSSLSENKGAKIPHDYGLFSSQKSSDGADNVAKPMDIHKSIPNSNVGFKLLSKLGWQEGQTLGNSTSSDGLIDPILPSNSSFTGRNNNHNPKASSNATKNGPSSIKPDPEIDATKDEVYDQYRSQLSSKGYGRTYRDCRKK